mmetsp:Transcript_13193/g.33806  ORF Transcript_13193/g.33806 Transcript_13193/m.33806 type:complete len:186 (-) Transcript_13193:355-912(-)
MGVSRFLPVFEGPDGSGGTFQLSQSKTITLHVAKLLGYLPASTSECAKASEVFHHAAEDVYAAVLGGIWGGNDALTAAIPKVRTRLAQLEILVARRGELGMARPVDFSDFAVLFTVDVIEQLFTPASAASVLSPMPTICANAALLRRRPGVKRALEQRPERITGNPREPEMLAKFQAVENRVLAP